MYFNTINFIFCFSAKLREIYLLVANMSLCYSMSGTLLDLLKEIASLCFRFLSFLFFFYLSSLLKKVDERRKSMSKV